MNAVERIQAAINKLEAFKAESTPGPWITDWCEYLTEADSELIVTLHRTIDAQLAILREGLAFARFNGGVSLRSFTSLADAIWGES